MASIARWCIYCYRYDRAGPGYHAENLTVKRLKDAKEYGAAWWYFACGEPVVPLFGHLLTEFAANTGITATGDKLFSAIAMHHRCPLHFQ